MESHLEGQLGKTANQSSKKITKTIPIDKAWGFFNNSSARLSKRFPMIKPIPDAWELRRDDDISTAYKFGFFWRFDVFRPLYNGWNDYLCEIGYLVGSMVMIIPFCILDVSRRLVGDLSGYSHFLGLPLLLALLVDLFISVFSILYCTIFASLSFTFSLLGLFSRPLMTALLGTNDPALELELKYSNNLNSEDVFELEYCYIKNGKRTSYQGIFKDTYLREPPSESDDNTIANLAKRTVEHSAKMHIKISERDLSQLALGCR